MTNQLFDWEVDEKPKRRPPATIPQEPLEAGWYAFRNRRGVAPFFHLLAWESPQIGAATVCGLEGTKLSNVGVDHMIRCPLCELAK